MENSNDKIARADEKIKGRIFILLFPLITLLLGMIVSGLSFALIPVHTNYISPRFMPPGWFFAIIWCILYPCIGMAAGYVYQQEKKTELRSFFVFYIAMLVTNFMFVPISNLSTGNPGVMTLMDLNGIVYATLFSWLCYCYSRTAFYWSLPLLLWMPITAGLKIALWITVAG